jgi:hypothetical protein
MEKRKKIGLISIIPYPNTVSIIQIKIIEKESNIFVLHIKFL